MTAAFLWGQMEAADDITERRLSIWNRYHQSFAALEAAGLKPEVAEVTWRAENSIELAGDEATRMHKLLDIIEDLDDVQNLYHNALISP